jgi:heme/copper-type cytochrome/quinol oxidase subunit 1
MVAVPIGIKIMRWALAILRDSKERHNLIHSSFLCFFVLFCLVLLDYAGVITFVVIKSVEIRNPSIQEVYKSAP